MEHTYSVIATIKNEQRTNDNKATILLRITVNGQRAHISIKRKIEPERWDSRANRVKGSKEDAREINNYIESSMVKLNRIHSRMMEESDIITAEKIKEVFAGNTVRLIEVFQYHNER